MKPSLVDVQLAGSVANDSGTVYFRLRVVQALRPRLVDVRQDLRDHDPDRVARLLARDLRR